MERLEQSLKSQITGTQIGATRYWEGHKVLQNQSSYGHYVFRHERVEQTRSFRSRLHCRNNFSLFDEYLS